MKKIAIISLLIFLTSCTPSNSTSPLNETSTGSTVTSHTTPKVYVSVVTHSEEYTHYEEDEEQFNRSRKELVSFAQMLHDEGVAYNYQSDWTFLLAATKFDKGDESTNGKNFLRYFKEDLGFEIDPHAHETKYNYADIAYLINELGVEPSHIAGGYLAYPLNLSKFDYLQNEIKGNIYDYTWQAEVLWGAGVRSHINESDLWTSGVWRPKSAEDITVDGGTLSAIGGYYNSWEGLDYLLTQDLDPNKIYTQAIFVPQGMSKNFISEFKAEIEKRKSDERIQWAGLGEILDIWASEYGSESNILKYDGTETDGKKDKNSTDDTDSLVKDKCGDGICDGIENKLCPQDC